MKAGGEASLGCKPKPNGKKFLERISMSLVDLQAYDI
jgi:hypothetical protein